MENFGSRRLQFSERLISAAALACDECRFEVAKRLLSIAEDDLRRIPSATTRHGNAVYEDLAAIHVRLWEAREAVG